MAHWDSITCNYTHPFQLKQWICWGSNTEAVSLRKRERNKENLSYNCLYPSQKINRNFAKIQKTVMTTSGSTLLGDKEEYISSDSKKKKKNPEGKERRVSSAKCSFKIGLSLPKSRALSSIVRGKKKVGGGSIIKWLNYPAFYSLTDLKFSSSKSWNTNYMYIEIGYVIDNQQSEIYKTWFPETALNTCDLHKVSLDDSHPKLCIF